MDSTPTNNNLPRSLILPTIHNSPSNHVQALLSAFTDNTSYKQMCAIFLGILQAAGIAQPDLLSIQGKLFHAKNIDQEINLKGQCEFPRSNQTLISSNMTNLELLIKSVEKTVFRQRQSQEKKQLIESCLQKMVNALPKTALDFQNMPKNIMERFNCRFPNKKRKLEIHSSTDFSIEKAKSSVLARRQPNQIDFFQAFRLLKICYGHGSPEEEVSYSQIFNVIYDKSGKLILSADQEGLIKIWSSQTGLLLSSLKGHASYMEELHTTQSNKYLVSVGNDGIRLWSLANLQCLGTIFFEKSVMTATSFTNSEDGSQIICFSDSEFFYLLEQKDFVHNKGRKIQLSQISSYQLPKTSRPNNLICQIQISKEGYVGLGLQSGEILLLDKTIFCRPIPQTVRHINTWQHTNKCVQIKWNSLGTMFVSCSIDGTCRIWSFSSEAFVSGNLRSIDQLRMPKNQKRRNKRKDIICNTVNWTCRQNYVITAFSECNKEVEQNNGQGDIVVYDAKKMAILNEVRSKLPYQLESINVLQPHPHHQNIAMFCECNGKIVVLDIVKCVMLAVFGSRGFHQSVEGKWCPDGNTFVVSSQFGNISIYGYGIKDFYNTSPIQQFYQSDSEVFIYDDNRTPITLDGNIDINLMDRGPICNLNKMPHHFNYKNNYQQLWTNGFISQKLLPKNSTTADCFKIGKDYLNMVADQMSQTANIQQVFKIAPLSVSDMELEDQKTSLNANIQRCIQQQVAEYNQTKSEHQLIVVEQPTIVQQPKTKQSRFKKLRRDYEESEQEQYKSEVQEMQKNYLEEEDDDSQEIIRKRKRPREYSPEDLGSTNPRTRRTVVQEINHLQDEYDQYISRAQQRNNRRRLQRLEDDEQDGEIAQEANRNSQTNSIPQDLCHRCYKDKIGKKCNICREGFCHNCRQFRGKDVGSSNEFRCFNCWMLKNTVQQQRQINKEPFKLDIRNSSYVPQIGDQVYFYFQGYQEFVSKYYDSFNPKICQMVDSFSLFEIDKRKELRQNPLCVVRRIFFLYPLKCRDRSDRSFNQRSRHNLLAAVQLQLISNKTSFYVYYIADGVDYLVRKEVAEHAQMSDLKNNNLELNKLVKVGGIQLQIVEKGPCDTLFPQSNWKWLLVRDGSQRLRRNHRADHRINIWTTDDFPSLPYVHIDQTLTKKIIANIQILKLTKPDLFVFFQRQVDTKRYPDYNTFVPVSICVDLIEKRLKNKYYVGIDSLLFDINMILSNSQIYNGDDHPVTVEAKQLKEQLIRIVGSGGNIQYDAKVKVKEESSEKQQKSKPKRLTRIRQNTNRQKQDSESYSERQKIQMQNSLADGSYELRIRTRSKNHTTRQQQQRRQEPSENRRVTRRTAVQQ